MDTVPTCRAHLRLVGPQVCWWTTSKRSDSSKRGRPFLFHAGCAVHSTPSTQRRLMSPGRLEQAVGLNCLDAGFGNPALSGRTCAKDKACCQRAGLSLEMLEAPPAVHLLSSAGQTNATVWPPRTWPMQQRTNRPLPERHTHLPSKPATILGGRRGIGSILEFLFPLSLFSLLPFFLWVHGSEP